MLKLKFLSSFILLAGVAGFSLPVQSQQPPEPAANAKTAPTATPSTTPMSQTSDGPKPPSPETVKKARLAGYRAKLRKGATLFCKEETEIGSHFSTEHCIDEGQLMTVLDRQQAQRDQLNNHTCQGCSGK